MTGDEFRACIRALGLTPARPSSGGATIHQDRDGEFHRIIDPEELNEAERAAYYLLIKQKLGFSDH